jgi:hypothetical protein
MIMVHLKPIASSEEAPIGSETPIGNEARPIANVGIATTTALVARVVPAILRAIPTIPSIWAMWMGVAAAVAVLIIDPTTTTVIDTTTTTTTTTVMATIAAIAIAPTLAAIAGTPPASVFSFCLYSVSSWR